MIAAISDDAAYPRSRSGLGAIPAALAATPAGRALAHRSYVIVPEVDTPHATLATAQNLPNYPFFGVIGTLGQGDVIDLYRMTLSASTLGVQLALVSHLSGAEAPAPVQLSVFDGTGRVLGTWSSDGAQTGVGAAIRLDPASQSAGSTLFLGISAAGLNGAGGSAPTTDYQLWVERLAAPNRSAASDGSAATPPVNSTSASASASPSVLAPFQSSAPVAPGPQAQGSGTASAQAAVGLVATGPGAGAGSSTGVSVAVGAMPTRAAGLLGGVLAAGDPTSVAVRPFSVTVTLDRADRHAGRLRLDPFDGAGDRARPDTPIEPEAQVALRGPGGFPLLGAAAIGDWRRTPDMVANALETWDLEESGTLPSEQFQPQAEVKLAVEAWQPPRWEESGLTLSFGLSVATVLTLNVLLSDPVAGFDYLASRLDSDPDRDPEADTDTNANQTRRAWASQRGK
jgi:hypothetical protein